MKTVTDSKINFRDIKVHIQEMVIWKSMNGL